MSAEFPSLLLFLLLPLAALGGWGFAQFHNRRVNGLEASELSSNYFRGLNYLLSEQQDKAIEVFLELAEVNRQTVETHLALGSLFRRRGETDKAIRYHMHIIGRENLSPAQRTLALHELGEDYMRAGLLDRAEKLFSELVGIGDYTESAVRHLLSIYEQEKDWEKAIEQAQRLAEITGESTGAMIAQFQCELANAAITGGDQGGAAEHLRQAREHNPDCARAYVIEASLARQAGDPARAIVSYQRACELDKSCFIQVLEPLLTCHRETGTLDEVETWLKSQVDAGVGISAVLALARLISEREDEGVASEFLLEYLHQRPSVRGLEYLVSLLAGRRESLADVKPELLQTLMRRLLDGQPVYRCQQCGFSGHTYHWLCPSCRQWETSRQVVGVLGE